jgi:aminocarboxymuconate-semialdehyde decarboxylase
VVQRWRGKRTLTFLVELVGSDRIALGADDPADMGLDQPVAWLKACTSLSPEQRTSILSANPARWLGLVPEGSVDQSAGRG